MQVVQTRCRWLLSSSEFELVSGESPGVRTSGLVAMVGVATGLGGALQVSHASRVTEGIGERISLYK